MALESLEKIYSKRRGKDCLIENSIVLKLFQCKRHVYMSQTSQRDVRVLLLTHAGLVCSSQFDPTMLLEKI